MPHLPRNSGPEGPAMYPNISEALNALFWILVTDLDEWSKFSHGMITYLQEFKPPLSRNEKICVSEAFVDASLPPDRIKSISTVASLTLACLGAPSEEVYRFVNHLID